MNITTRGVGDTVYLIREVPEKDPVTCAVCSQTGKVTLNSKQFDCPQCGGRFNLTGGDVRTVFSMVVDRVLVCARTEGTSIRYEGVVEGKVRIIAEADTYSTEAEANAAL